MFQFLNITKHIKGSKVLDDISYRCKPGEILGLLGAHDSGKSTLLRILAGLSKADSGKILYNDKIVTRDQFSRFSYMPEERSLYQEAQVLDLLIHIAQMHGLSSHDAKIEAVRHLDRFNLVEKSKLKINQLNKVETQKIELLASIIHNPEVFILDAPFYKMDSQNQNLLKATLLNMQKDNKIIILASHQVDFIQSICNTILILNDGKNVLSGNAQHIINQFCDDYISIVIDENSDYEELLRKRADVADFYKIDNEIRIFLKKGIAKNLFLAEIAKYLNIYKYQIAQASLKDILLTKIPNQLSIED